MARYSLFVLKVPLNPNQPTIHEMIDPRDVRQTFDSVENSFGTICIICRRDCASRLSAVTTSEQIKKEHP